MMKHFNYSYLLSQETFDPQIKFENIFLPYHILQKINNSLKSSTLNIQINIVTLNIEMM